MSVEVNAAETSSWTILHLPTVPEPSFSGETAGVLAGVDLAVVAVGGREGACPASSS
ncbi:MAG: hypothetical protein HPM95_13375 [Alphaproteobacteria bacterium]|nr:hypothetical protein [Alphaproteobacteria bacterium]